MMPKIIFFAHGEPKGQPRPKAFARGGHAAVYDPGTAEGWKGQVALAAKEHIPAHPIIGPVHLTLAFYLKRPKAHFGRGGHIRESAPIFHTGKPDADNFAKAIMDALTQLHVWGDDSQVAELRVTKFYANTCTGCRIEIKEASL